MDKSVRTPILIGSLLALWEIFIIVLLVALGVPALVFAQSWWVIVIAMSVFVLQLFVICAIIYVTIERVKEIRKGEYDDLSQY